MTPFGAKIRKLREARGLQLQDMARDLQISSPYLSALEHGHRGRPQPGLVMQIANYFELIWDDVEDLKRLASLSHPRVVVDTGGMTPKATLLANLLAEHIGDLSDDAIDALLAEMGFDEELIDGAE
ncbi:MAG: helix-turn-helix transcriptional regulator [Proteobacteria bacterium]|nr:helix-turn-helix transcriptional regulator [Pseudomonadota bacterium]